MSGTFGGKLLTEMTLTERIAARRTLQQGLDILPPWNRSTIERALAVGPLSERDILRDMAKEAGLPA